MASLNSPSDASGETPRALAPPWESEGSTPLPVRMRVLLLALPWFVIPPGITLPLPASILAGLFVIAQHFSQGAQRLKYAGYRQPLRGLLFATAFYWVLSAIYGTVNLSAHGSAILHLTVGDVAYGPVAVQRLVLLAVCFTLFELARGQSWSIVRGMHWWLVGTVVVIGVQLLCQVSKEAIVQHGGTFAEGNHAGMYYVISLFVSLEYRRRRPTQLAIGFVLCALLGMLLCQSATGVLVGGVALFVRAIARAPSFKTGLRNAVLSIAVIGAVGSVMVAAGLDFGISDKLFEEELTPASYSRIDRLMSINAALDLFSDSPVIGQGLQTYGFLSNDLLEGPLDLNYDGSYRRITNNVYAEMASEVGLAGLGLMLAIVAAVIGRLVRSGNDQARNLLAGVVAMLIYWLAFPTYTVAYLWIFMGLCCRDAVGPQPPGSAR